MGARARAFAGPAPREAPAVPARTARRRDSAHDAAAWAALEREIVSCERCPRLRAFCLEVAREKRRAFRDQQYWGRPLPGFGDRRARLLLVGLAPAAHGANRTGRMFTGDQSGDFLYAALHRAGLATAPRSVSRDDRLRLRGAYVTAAARCAPPANRPLPGELAACRPFLEREIALLRRVRVVVALGAVAWEAVLRISRAADAGSFPRPRPRFAHGAEARLRIRPGAAPVLLLGSYHPSRQNTQTGRLTPAMLRRVLGRALREAWPGPPRAASLRNSVRTNRAGRTGAIGKENRTP